MTKDAKTEKFSDQLEAWLKSKQPKTFDSLILISEDKSFAIVFLLLMIFPALPIPTGGITHVFEIIVMLLSLELIIGLNSIWLPKRWRAMKLGKVLGGKIIPVLVGRVRKVEKYSSPRWHALFSLPLVPRFIGLSVFGLTLAAFLSPPFSGLDTLPSIGVVLVSLAVILEDSVLLLVGLVVGALGVGISVAFGKAIIAGAHHLL